MEEQMSLLAPEPPSPAERFTAPDEFDWSTDPSVIFGYQPATAVYRNKFDAIVIRQEATNGDEDCCVYFRDAAAVNALMVALKAELKGGRE